jgi:hypothetical protein
VERDVVVVLQVTRPRYLAVCGLVRAPPGAGAATLPTGVWRPRSTKAKGLHGHRVWSMIPQPPVYKSANNQRMMQGRLPTRLSF